MTFDPKNDVRDARPKCLTTGKRQHNWEFNEQTGIGKCKNEGCDATIDTNERVTKRNKM